MKCRFCGKNADKKNIKNILIRKDIYHEECWNEMPHKDKFQEMFFNHRISATLLNKVQRLNNSRNPLLFFDFVDRYESDKLYKLNQVQFEDELDKLCILSNVPGYSNSESSRKKIYKISKITSTEDIKLIMKSFNECKLLISCLNYIHSGLNTSEAINKVNLFK